MPLSLKHTNNKQKWDKFITLSQQGNIFSTTPFLDALGADYNLLFVNENKQPQLGALILKHKDKPIKAPHPFSSYQGIFFNHSIDKTPYHRRIRKKLKLTDFLLAKMEKEYHLISFCLHYKAEDLRSFQWFHYHKPKLGRFNIKLRYTGLLDLSTMSSFSRYLSEVRKVRRQEFKYAQKAELVIEASKDLDTFIHLYQLTFKRQGIKLNKNQKRLILTITKAALSKNFGQLLICRHRGKEATSATLFLYDSYCGYYLIGANNPKYRKTGSGTYLLLENIKRCKKKGLKYIDFCGINSPNRGDFKTSFNAVPTPYFIVTWKKPR